MLALKAHNLKKKLNRYLKSYFYLFVNILNNTKLEYNIVVKLQRFSILIEILLSMVVLLLVCL